MCIFLFLPKFCLCFYAAASQCPFLQTIVFGVHGMSATDFREITGFNCIMKYLLQLQLNDIYLFNFDKGKNYL